MLPVYSISSLLTTLYKSIQNQGQRWGGFWLSSWVANPVTLLRGLGLYIRNIIAHPLQPLKGDVLALGWWNRDTPGLGFAEKTIGHPFLPSIRGTSIGSMVHSMKPIHLSSFAIFLLLFARLNNSSIVSGFICLWSCHSFDAVVSCLTVWRFLE